MIRVFFLSLISRNFEDRLSSNFDRFVVLCICWDTPSEKTSLGQLPIVTSVFKAWLHSSQRRSLCTFSLWYLKITNTCLFYKSWTKEGPCTEVTRHWIYIILRGMHSEWSNFQIHVYPNSVLKSYAEILEVRLLKMQSGLHHYYLYFVNKQKPFLCSIHLIILRRFCFSI